MPLCSNYGGTLQNYALQSVLRGMGHQPVTMRFPTQYQDMPYLKYLKLYVNLLIRHWCKRLLCRPSQKPLTLKKWKENTSSFEKFIQQHISVTDYMQSITLDDCKKYEIELLVVGSDQIWRPEVRNVIWKYFCGFAEDSGIHRISYAASFAVDRWLFNNQQTEEIRRLIGKFNAISVREKSGVELCKNHLNVQATWVLDPTLLLEKTNYDLLIQQIPPHNKKFIFAYILDNNKDKKNAIKQLSSKMGLEVLYMNDRANNRNASIENWLSSFRDARFVITDSFHGSVFSIIFKKEFACFTNEHRGNDRMDSLKEITGLYSRFINPGDVISEEAIDYVSVDKRLSDARKDSFVFLKRNLI